VRGHPLELGVTYSLLELFRYTGERHINGHPGIH
jgi:hypothetical protein